MGQSLKGMDVVEKISVNKKYGVLMYSSTTSYQTNVLQILYGVRPCFLLHPVRLWFVYTINFHEDIHAHLFIVFTISNHGNPENMDSPPLH